MASPGALRPLGGAWASSRGLRLLADNDASFDIFFYKPDGRGQEI
jgi:hypothetical protein